MGTNEYQCAVCKGVFEKAWTDEEALNEFAKLFHGESLNDADIVCDDCFHGLPIPTPAQTSSP